VFRPNIERHEQNRRSLWRRSIVPQRIRDKGQQHLPGDEAWLIGEHRMLGEKKYYLANLVCVQTNRWGVHARLLVEAQRLDPRRQAEAVETHAGFAGRASHHVVDQERADVAAFGIDRETCRWARSAITACKRSYWPCTLWYSTITFSPLV
jgi:hypothetical protein